MDYNPLLISVLVFVTSCQDCSAVQSFPPTNVTAVYVADGSIRVTWSPPNTTENIEQYYVKVQTTGEYHHTRSPDVYVYQYNKTKPDTSYTFEVGTAISNTLSGVSQTTVTTPAAIFRQRGKSARLVLPKPLPGLSTIELSGRALFTFVGGEVDGNSTTEDGITVRLITTYAKLVFEVLTTEHAGYYYTMLSSGNVILGGQLLVVTDSPTRPTIAPSSRSPVLDTSVILGCLSKSRSKPDNHGLVLTSSWKVNGSDVNHDRYFVSCSNLVINPVRLRDKYNVYTCVTHEDGQGSSRLSSEESSGFLLTPRFPSRITALSYLDVVVGEYRPIGTSYTIRYTEGFELVLSVDVDSNPDPDVTLSRDQTTIAVGVPGTAGKYDVQLSDNLQCNHTGRYQVRAANFVTRNRSNIGPSVMTFELLVSCSPRRQGTMNSVIGVAGKMGQIIALNVTVIANPKPTGRWSAGVRSPNVIPNNAYMYTIRGEVTITQQSDFREYHVNVINGIGGELIIKFEIRTPGVPDKPIDFRASEVGQNIIKVAWTSGFNGGFSQEFHIDFMIVDNEWLPGTLNIPDAGQGALMVYTLPDLTPTTYYAIRLNVSNKLGPRYSSEMRVRTLGVPDKPIGFRASEVGQNIIKVAWTSGYNGGMSQQFHIDSMIVGNEWLPGTSNISDAGQGALMTYTHPDLTPATDYIIRLNVFNKLGPGISSEIRVRTLEIPLTASPQSSVTFALIGVIVILTVALIIAIFVIRRIRSQQGQEHTYVNQDFQGSTTNRHLQSSGNLHELQERAVQEQEHMYDIVNDDRRGLEVGVNEGGATTSDSQYTGLEPSRGQEHMYDKPQHDSTATRGRQGRAVRGSGYLCVYDVQAAKEDGLVYIAVEITAERSEGKDVIPGEIDITHNAFVDSSQIAPN